MDKFVIIDGNNIFFRSFYALPQLTNARGEISNAVFGFVHTLLRVIEKYQPKYIAVAFDSPGKTFRHELYGQYKGTRDEAPSELIMQFPIIKEMLKAMNITYIEMPTIEADDIIGTLSMKFDTENIIVSADKDLLQLIKPHTCVYAPKSAKVDPVLYTASNLKEEFGVEPKQIVDLKALMGDASDNIPGVKGIGPKTATTLLEKYKTLDGVYENISDLPKGQQEKLSTFKDDAYLSYVLATIKRDVDIDCTLSDFEYTFPWSIDVRDLFVRYEFNSLLKRDELFNEHSVSKIEEQKCTQVEINSLDDIDALLEGLKKSKELSLYLDGAILHLYIGGVEYFNPNIDSVSAADILSKVLAVMDKNYTLYLFDYKNFLHSLDRMNVTYSRSCRVVDLMLLRYLYNTNARTVTKFSDIAYEENLAMSQPAYTMYNLSQKYLQLVKDNDLLSLYTDIELPLSTVLYDMENAGFLINRDVIHELKSSYETRIEKLVNDIYTLAGSKFNLNSSKQLADVLFIDLGIRLAGKKKKLSTNHEVLEEIKDMHPIVPLILDYRQLFKLYSTYIVSLEDLIQADGKIHTIFNQALTTTGRLSSSDPNLQNIPIRTEEGRNIRRMFIPSDPKGSIVSADYSQIELRLLAHMSGDETLIEAFKNGDDIHTATASKIFGVKYEDVTAGMRRDAKAINFGIVYGISDYGLAQNIKIPLKQAKEYISRYFEEHPKIRQYMDSNVAFCKEHGYVKTLFGRMRVIPEIKSSNFNLRQFGERASMNMPLQGTASDIIKIAMINVANEIKKNNLRSKIVVQVHDELVCDVASGEEDKIAEILRDCMENVVNLSVPLTVNVARGKNWFELKD